MIIISKYGPDVHPLGIHGNDYLWYRVILDMKKKIEHRRKYKISNDPTVPLEKRNYK